MQFDSSQYHLDAAHQLSQVSLWKGYAIDLESAMQEFVDRCERGEILSTYTYRKFKNLVDPDENE